MSIAAEIAATRQLLIEAKAHREANGTVEPTLDAQYERAVVGGDYSALVAGARPSAALAQLAGHHGRVATATGRATVVDAPPATAPQLRYLASLLRERDGGDFNVRVQARIDGNELTKADASKAIEFLKKAPAKASPFGSTTVTLVTEAPAPRVEVTEGYWLVGETVYKVVPSRSSGRLYASKLQPPAEGESKGTWEYAPGALATIAQGGVELTLEAASKLGQVHGFCCRCGRRLDKPESIAAGIGPVCATKFS